MEQTIIHCVRGDYYDLFNPRVEIIGFHHAQPGDQPKQVSRVLEDFDLWYVQSGSGRVRIDHAWIDFFKNDVFVFKPGQLYCGEELIELQSEYAIYFVHFLPFGEIRRDLDARLASEFPQKLPSMTGMNVGEHFRELFDLHDQKPEGYELQAKAHFLNILNALLTRLHAERWGEPAPACLPQLHKAVDFIHDRFSKDIDLVDIAHHAGLSPSHLSCLFSKFLHRSPIDYLIDLRLSAAKRLMINGHFVSEAAYGTGFHSVHYFSRTFKKRNGLSPTQYIKLCRKWEPLRHL